MKKIVVSCWLLVVGALAANAAEITINVDEGQTFAYAIDGGELVQTGEEGPAKVTFAANRNATYSFYGVAEDGTVSLIKSVEMTDAGETVNETGNAQVAVDTRATKEIDGSAGAVKVDLTYSGDDWGATVGGSATITLALGEGEAKPYRTGLTGNGAVEWTPTLNGRYEFRHVVTDGTTETAVFVVNELELPGSERNPWKVGEGGTDVVQAYVKDGVLVIAGSGAMADFASAADVPWAPYVDELDGAYLPRAVKVPASVAATLPISVEGGSGEPSGAVSGAEPERIEIVGGKAYLAVSVCTNGDVTAATEGWQKAKVEAVDLDEETGEAILTVPATAEKGFMFLKSKGADPSNRSGRPDTADIQHD